MAEMVERVARAVNEHLGVSLAFTEPSATDTPTIAKCRIADTERAMAIARAAIEAMRSPTEAMRSAVDKAEDEGGYIAAAYEHIEWGKAWPVAIDAALTE